MSTEYLRDFINEHVGPECGGDGSSLVNPQTLQTQLNDLKSRVSKLENGIGFSASYSTSIFVACQQYGSSFIAPIVADGTISSIAVLADKGSATSGIAAITVQVTGENPSTTTLDLEPEKMTSALSTDIPVREEDTVAITYKAVPNSSQSNTYIPAEVLYIGLLIKLPDKALAIGQK